MRRLDSALANGAVSEMAFQRRATALGVDFLFFCWVIFSDVCKLKEVII